MFLVIFVHETVSAVLVMTHFVTASVEFFIRGVMLLLTKFWILDHFEFGMP